MTSAIRVKGVSKEYHLGELKGYKTLRESLAGPFTRNGSERGNGTASDESERIWALKDVSFEVEAGEVVGVIGHNGAGKTTLLKILPRITEPTAGEVELFGRVSSLLEVGTGFHPELTGRENIFLNGSILGMTRREIAKKFDEIVDFSGIDRFLATPVKRYSSGMQVRLAFAVAAHLEPEILLVDEALAVGDAEFQRKCLGKMGEIAHGGRTIVFVSHNLAAIERLCTSGLLINHGEIQKRGSIDECISSYLKVFEDQRPLADKASYLDSVELHDLSNGPLLNNSLPIGSGFRIKARFRTPEPTKRPKFGIVLRRLSTGEPVFSASTVHSGGIQVPQAARQFAITMTIESSNIVPGEYVTDIYIGNEFKNFETLYGAIQIRFHEADVFGSGVMPFTHFGPVFFRPRFEIE
jgi:lipopolysaccharide transport system ATP-binding protein